MHMQPKYKWADFGYNVGGVYPAIAIAIKGEAMRGVDLELIPIQII